MIFADKLISLRKKAGWSQEELAERLSVTRQSVSKWEGAQSFPDIGKIVQLSQLFGVSTDYLLKDEMEQVDSTPCNESAESVPALRRVTMEQASEYLSLRRAAAPRLALATFLCVVSPTALLMLSALSEAGRIAMPENAAAGFGLLILLALVAAGVILFLSSASKVKDYEYLDKESFETEYGVEGMVRERQRDFRETYNRLNIVGTTLCILSAMPLFASMALSASEVLLIAGICLLLFIAACGCVAFVYGGVQQSAMQRLLEEGAYSRRIKARGSIRAAFSVAYWLIVTAIFLVYTFGPSGNAQPSSGWIIWAVAGVLYGAVAAIMGIIERGAYKQ